MLSKNCQHALPYLCWLARIAQGASDQLRVLQLALVCVATSTVRTASPGFNRWFGSMHALLTSEAQSDVSFCASNVGDHGTHDWLQ